MIQKNILLKEKTQKDLAKALGLSKVSVSKKVNGLLRFSLPEVKKVKDYLDLTNDEVVEIFING